MSEVGNSLRIPMYLAAPTRDRLVRLMLEHNLSKGKEHRYFDISFDGKNWVAWFYDVMTVTSRDMTKPKGTNGR